MRSFDVVHRFRLKPTLSSFPPERADAVVVVVVVIVDVASRRNAKENTTHSLYESYFFRSLVLQAIAMYFTSCTIFDQYSANLSVSSPSIMDSSM